MQNKPSLSAPLISICIPAYKRVEFLKRLLDSILVQQFMDFEVIVTDDSPDEQVRQLCQLYVNKFPLQHFRNEVQLGTPENWNEAIRRAEGKWIKLMHDDDWFAHPDSLAEFAAAIERHPEADFFFSAYTNVQAETKDTTTVYLSSFRLKAMYQNPVTLLSQNIVGPPSVTIHRNNGKFFYDKTVKWVVDIDFYIRYFQQLKPVYIDSALVMVGLGAHQVTTDCVGQRKVEIPENFYLLKKVGVEQLKNIMVFDAWWRLIRNLEITDPKEIREAGYLDDIHPAIINIIARQKHVPRRLLSTGIVSKALMYSCYRANKNLLA